MYVAFSGDMAWLLRPASQGVDAEAVSDDEEGGEEAVHRHVLAVLDAGELFDAVVARFDVMAGSPPTYTGPRTRQRTRQCRVPRRDERAGVQPSAMVVTVVLRRIGRCRGRGA